MKKNRVVVVSCLAVAALAMASSVRAETLLIVAADGNPPVQQLTGDLFTQVDTFNSIGGTPTLQQLQGYDVVLAYCNSIPQDPETLGNVLADYVDGGGSVIICTYGISEPWAIDGRIQTTGYNPLVKAGNGDVSGEVVALLPGDPVFNTPNAVNPGAITMFHNTNFAHPGVDNGATLLADDGAGVALLAVNGGGTVMGANMFPATSPGGNNAEFYALLENIAARSMGGTTCHYLVKKSKAKGGCDACPPKGGDYRSQSECEAVNDCVKKVKTTIGCPNGGNGTCKLKGKRDTCG